MIYDSVGGGVLLLFFMCLLLLAVLHKLTMFSFNVDHIRLFCHTYLKNTQCYRSVVYCGDDGFLFYG